MAITIRLGRPRLKGTQRMETLSKHSLQQSDARRDQEDGIGGRDDIFCCIIHDGWIFSTKGLRDHI